MIALVFTYMVFKFFGKESMKGGIINSNAFS